MAGVVSLIASIDAVLATHVTTDHIDVNVAAAVMQNCRPMWCRLFGPKTCVGPGIGWGVPKARLYRHATWRCREDQRSLRSIGSMRFRSHARLISPPGGPKSRWRTADGMDSAAVNYLFKTPGGNCTTCGDSTILQNY
ncbi:hypothetical protein LAD77_02095 [Klebsiella pneumoniae]|nr:hypothetical protein [Klebsiella pneumoniae]